MVLYEKITHQKKLENLAREIYKFVNGLSPKMIKYFFSFGEIIYNLSNFQS